MRWIILVVTVSAVGAGCAKKTAVRGGDDAGPRADGGSGSDGGGGADAGTDVADAGRDAPIDDVDTGTGPGTCRTPGTEPPDACPLTLGVTERATLPGTAEHWYTFTPSETAPHTIRFVGQPWQDVFFGPDEAVGCVGDCCHGHGDDCTLDLLDGTMPLMAGRRYFIVVSPAPDPGPYALTVLRP